jgi:hypothetical protein
VPFAVLGLLLLSLALRMPEALGPAGLPVVALALGLVLASVPVRFVTGSWRRPAAGLACLCVVSSTAALLLPKVTPDRPEHGSMLAVEQAGAEGALLAYRPASGRLHEDVAAAARFERKDDVFPWMRRRTAYAAPLAPLGEPFPSLSVLAEERRTDGTRRLLLRLASPRGAPSVGLFFAGGVVPGSIRVQGQPLAAAYLRGQRPAGGPARVFCRAVPPEGIVVELAMSGESREAIVLDETQGLPGSALTVARARPTTVAPVDGGDLTVLYRRIAL